MRGWHARLRKRRGVWEYQLLHADATGASHILTYGQAVTYNRALENAIKLVTVYRKEVP